MGIFDIFKSEKKTRSSLGIFHGMDCREWNDGYKKDEKSIIKFIKKKLESMTQKEFINFLKKRENYRKFVHTEVSEIMNKISVTEPKGISSYGLTKFGFIFYPSVLLEKDSNITGFKIVDSDVKYERKKGMNFEKSKTLIILSQDRKQEYLDFWEKKLSWGKAVHYIGFQFVDLDEDEYKFLKPFENKLKKNHSDLFDTWNEFIDVGYQGLFATEKRKAYPINRFQTYLVFEE